MTAVASGNGRFSALLREIADMDRQLAEAVREERQRASHEPEASYYAGESNRFNPAPAGVQPLGSDADEHYPTAYSYYLIAERGRHAVRNNGLVESGVNRLCSNLRITLFELDMDSGDEAVDRDVKAKWDGWCADPAAADYEGERDFREKARQSFFSQVVDGDLDHLPLRSGHLQTWESHHIRNPYGVGISQEGATLTHGIERQRGRVAAHWIADQGVQFRQVSGSVFSPTFSPVGSGRYRSRRFPVYDEAGNRQVFRLGFFHRFWQGRGISRLSPPRESMNGFERLNYSNIHSSVKRALISYLMSSMGTDGGIPRPPNPNIPNAGTRNTETVSYVGSDGSMAVDTITIETPEGPAQVVKPPDGWRLDGWNANLPPQAFFEHASLMLTMLAVNLDLPLMFLLLDGSRVNFHGGRMITDQIRLRFTEMQQGQISGLWNPTFDWKVRQWTTPGSPHFDPVLARHAERGDVNLQSYRFAPAGWPYVKPLEDVMADRAAVEGRIRSLRRVLGKYGIDLKDHIAEVVGGEIQFAEAAAQAATAFVEQHPELALDVRTMFFRILDGSKSSKIQLNLTGAIGGGGDASTEED